MNPIIIFGAGDLAREFAFLVRELNVAGQDWDLQGFVVEDESLWGKEVDGYPIIAGVAELNRRGYTGGAVVGVGVPKVARKIVSQIKATDLAVDFPSLIHPSVVCDRGRLTMGRGVVICAGSILTTNVTLGDFTIINLGSTIAHDVVTGCHTVINPQANISGAVVLEDFTYIGAGAVIMQGKRIGKGAQICMGAAVSVDVSPWAVVGGNPARVIQQIEPWGEE